MLSLFKRVERKITRKSYFKKVCTVRHFFLEQDFSKLNLGIYIYLHISVCVYAYMHTQTYAYNRALFCILLHACIHIHAHTHMCVGVHSQQDDDIKKRRKGERNMFDCGNEKW